MVKLCPYCAKPYDKDSSEWSCLEYTTEELLVDLALPSDGERWFGGFRHMPALSLSDRGPPVVKGDDGEQIQEAFVA